MPNLVVRIVFYHVLDHLYVISARGANGPETKDERDDLVRSLGERTGRKSGVGSGVGGCIGSRFGAGARSQVDGRNWDRNRNVLCRLGAVLLLPRWDCARPATRDWGGGGARHSTQSGYCRPEETRVPGRIRWTRLR
jgi:hypothetical protein